MARNRIFVHLLRVSSLYPLLIPCWSARHLYRRLEARHHLSGGGERRNLSVRKCRNSDEAKVYLGSQ